MAEMGKSCAAGTKFQPSEMEDWASILVIALLVGLWLLWPKHASPSRRGLPPEPSCAYVTLPGNFPTTVAAHGPSTFNSGFTRLPTVPKPGLPTPMKASVMALDPEPFNAAPVVAMDLPPTPPSPFGNGTAQARNVMISADPVLLASGFSVDLASVTSSVPYSLTATLAFGQDGRLSTLLVDSFEGAPSELAPLRLSLLLSRTTRAATGRVTIWRR